MTHHEPQLDPADTQPPKERVGPAYRKLIIAGVAGLVIALVAALVAEDGLAKGIQRFAFAYLLSIVFVLTIALGSLFLVMVTHLFRAGWVVLIRRPAEIFAATMPTVGLLFVPILLFVFVNNGMLYKWAQPIEEMKAAAGHGEHAIATYTIVKAAAVEPEHETDAASHAVPHADTDDRTQVAGHHIEYIKGKRPWLNIPFWIIRCVAYFAIWSAFGLFYFRKSTQQDTSGDPDLTNQREWWAPVGVLIFALTITFAAFDIVMSLEPVWYSTIFGVYFFAGSVGAAVATLTLVLMGLQRRGFLKAVNTEHYHDLGKLQFTFVFFWGYIAFCQFMLIWYANLPATTYWYEYRGVSTAKDATNGWTTVTLVLLFGNLLIPFAGLLSRHVKRHRKMLAFWAIWLLVMHWIDLWWLVMPQLSETVKFPLVEIAAVVGLAALFFAAALRRAADHSLVPVQDPRLGESLAFENF